MSALDDYKNKGGLNGIAESLLSTQLQEASKDPKHLFAGVADALAKDKPESAANCLITILADLPEGHPLAVLKMVFFTLPAIHSAYKDAVKTFLDGFYPDDDLPKEIIAWAAMGAINQSRAQRAATASRRGNSGKKKLIEIMMRAGRDEGLSLKEFLASARNASIEGLSVTTSSTVGKEKFIFDECGSDSLEYEAGEQALEKCWSAARRTSKNNFGN